MNFEIISEIKNIEVIAIGNKINDVNRLIKFYGNGRWRKMKGFADIFFKINIFNAELHWNEAHGLGKIEFKIIKLIY